MNEVFKQDWKRYKRSEWSWKCILSLLKSQTMRYIWAGRLSVCQNPISKLCGGGYRNILDIKWDVRLAGKI